MKKLIPAYIISLVFSFMLYIYEPIIMYANNMDDFWFGLYIIIGPLLKMFSHVFLALSLFFTIIYLINDILSKKKTVYDICLLIYFVIFICTYIQGNFLAGSLPSLDGGAIKWNQFIKEDIISIVVFIIVSGLVAFSSIKFKTDKVVKYTGAVAGVVLVMLLSSFITTLTTTKNLYTKDVTIASTTKNVDMASTDENFFIFLLDAVDSVEFDDVMSNDKEFKDLFTDFTYYKDTMSVYPYTRDSIPFILSGIWNDNKMQFSEYSTYALDNSKLLKELNKKNYSTNIYESELKWNSYEALKNDNIVGLEGKMDSNIYIREQTKYILFKYLPFPLKKYSKIEKLDFNDTKIISDYTPFSWSNPVYYKHIKESAIEKTDKKYFQFLHIEGGHVPHDQDRNVEYIPDGTGTYKQKLEACLTIIKSYINRLKENGVYDNSNIIIMADHGYNYDDVYGRQNPILFIKGKNEHHDMYRSNKAISYEDLNEAYLDLLDGKKSKELFKNIDNKRERRFLFYEFLKEDNMIEYVQKGKAWDESTLVPTGKEFNR